MAKMIECRSLAGEPILVNPDHIITATYNESQETCNLWLTEYEHSVEVALTWEQLKKLLSDENY